MEKFEESSSEWEREEGIQNRVDARVGVSQHVAADLGIIRELIDWLIY